MVVRQAVTGECWWKDGVYVCVVAHCFCVLCRDGLALGAFVYVKNARHNPARCVHVWHVLLREGV